MPYTLIAHAVAQGSSGGSTTTPPIDTTGVDLIVIVASTNSVSDPLVTDNKGNAYPIRISDTSSSAPWIFIHSRQSPVIGTGHTFSAGTVFGSICVLAFGGSLTIPTEPMTHNFNNSAGFIQPGVATPTLNNEVVIIGVGTTNVSPSSIDGGFIISDNQPFVPANSMGCAAAYLIQTTAAAVNPTWTLSSVGISSTAMVSFKASITVHLPNTRSSLLSPILAQ